MAMQMEHGDYVELKEQLICDLNSVYRRIDDCGDIVAKEEKQIEGLTKSMTELKVEQTKTNTRLGILIGILSAIGVPILGVCVKLLFGS